MPSYNHADSFGSRSQLEFGSNRITYYRLAKLAEAGIADVSRLPFSIKILIENVLRSENGVEIGRDDVERLAKYNPASPSQVELPFMPARVLLQDFTGVPCVVDLAAMRSAMARHGGDPQRINPLVPVDLVIDHSVQVDHYGTSDSEEKNSAIEFARNRERYEFLRWGQTAFKNFRVIPPSSGICHQVNLEYLAQVIRREGNGDQAVAFFDTVVGTDSHTPMVNGLGVVGWGVGGIEAEAVMLGQPLYFITPDVIGVKLTGALCEGVTATDLVLTITQMLRKKGVVDKFVEFFGPGLSAMSVPDRATLSNMAPEYGATIGYFPIDHRTLEYMRYSGRPEELVILVERYAKEQGVFRTDATPDPLFKDTLQLDLSTVEGSLAGPKRPQDKTTVTALKSSFRASLTAPFESQGFGLAVDQLGAESDLQYGSFNGKLRHGDVAIAAITSCTNTSNPAVLIAAVLVARKAVEAGLTVNPYVKTSLAPGSRVATDYLNATGLMPYLDKLGFNVVGYGCTTCIGNSGAVPEEVAKAVSDGKLVVSAVLSGNRNFTGRINPVTKASYLASPPLVVAYAIAGTVDKDLTTEPIGVVNGKNIYLKDIWPSNEEIEALLPLANDPKAFHHRYDGIEESNPNWNAIPTKRDAVYHWDDVSTYLQEPPFFKNLKLEVGTIMPIEGARVLVKTGDSITTDHISPAGNIAAASPAGKWLMSKGVEAKEFNSYGSRRGNDLVMTRGTFANAMFRNHLGQGREGSWTTHQPSNELMTIFDASLRYAEEEVQLIVLAGVDYGMGSSRDWAAKGVNLLGVRAVIAQSFERIHRSNLVGMGVLPLQFKPGENAEVLGLSGSEIYAVQVDDNVKPHQEITVEVTSADGGKRSIQTICRLDSGVEVNYYRNGGILHTVLRRFMKTS